MKHHADVTHILITDIKVSENCPINIELMIFNIFPADENGKGVFFSAETKSTGLSCGFLQMICLSSGRFL